MPSRSAASRLAATRQSAESAAAAAQEAADAAGGVDPVPILAAVNGAAYGGGCEMVATADFAYVAKRARFALTEVTLGIMPGAMGTQNLPRAVGVRRAKEIILTGLPSRPTRRSNGDLPTSFARTTN